MKRDGKNLRKLIRRYGFKHVEDHLIQIARPSIRVETQQVKDESELPIGASKIGGRPDLPPDTPWPLNEHTGQSLAFIAQFDLHDVKPFDEENLLPETGMLYFFCRYNEGFGGKVLYTEAATVDLKRVEFPEDIPPTPPLEWGVRYDPCSLTFIPEVNLPDIDRDVANLNNPSRRKKYDYYDLYYAASYSDSQPRNVRTVNRILGYDYDIPDELQLDCELWDAAGRPQYHVVGTAEQRALAEQQKGDWQLLFQMSSDLNAGMMWSDSGMICYYIRRDDLKAKKFDKACFTGFSS